MLLLVSTSDKLQVVTGSAGTIDVHASWMDNVAGAVVPGRTNTNISTATTTDVVASPAASTQRNVKTLHIRNRGITSNMITVQHTDGTIVAQLHRTLLAAETTLQYIDEIGFIVSSTATGSSSVLTLTPSAPQGRLTLQAGQPVMTSTQASRTTLYYSPYTGNQIPIYNTTTTSWAATPFNEISVITTDAAKNPAAIGVSKVNDWFVWNDAGTLRLSHGTDWASDTDRSGSTGITRLNGIWVNTAAITNGPGVNQGTFVGTTRSNASSQLDWIYGGAALNGLAGFFGIWNAYNRAPVSTLVMDTSTSSWSYTGPAWRASHGSLTMRASYVTGLMEDVFTGVHYAIGYAGDQNPMSGVGYDTTTATSGIVGTNGNAGASTPVTGAYTTTSLGFHFLSALETSIGTANFYGASTDARQSGFYFGGTM